MSLDQEKVKRVNDALDSIKSMIKGFREDMLDLCVEYIETIDEHNNADNTEVVEEKAPSETPKEESTSYTQMYL